MHKISALSPAKINLTLDVVGTRADGYHLVRSVVHTVALYDTIHFRFGGAGLRFRCDKPQLSSDDNLCLKAARAWSQTAQRVLDCEIELQKVIPTGAGLGGGSGNAATVLQTLNRHFDNALDFSALLEIAANLGADVPLFLRDEKFSTDCALMEGIGEKITPLCSVKGWIVVAQPMQSLATPQVFREYDNSKIESSNATDRVLDAIRNGADLPEIAPLLANDLTNAAQVFVPQIGEMIEVIKRAGAINAMMSGSGSAVFGVCENEESAHRVLDVLRDSCELRFGAVATLI